MQFELAANVNMLINPFKIAIIYISYTKQKIIRICTAIQCISNFQSLAAFSCFNILAVGNSNVIDLSNELRIVEYCGKIG